MTESAPTIAPDPAAASRFQVHLDVFSGPFDLLLGLIAKHKLDITEIALATVTDEFIAYIRGRDADWDLDQASEFLVVASTLLDLKAARLLPSGEVDDEEDLAVLEARDLLFARLLQYRAYKTVAGIFTERMRAESRHHPRAVGLEEPFSRLLPEVLIGTDAEGFADLAARVLAPRPEPTVPVSHLHAPRVSVREQAAIVVEMLRRAGGVTFRSLVSDCDDVVTVVARFLALLELYREAVVGFDQVDPFGELHLRWTGGQRDDIDLHTDLDEGVDDRVDDEEESVDDGLGQVATR